MSEHSEWIVSRRKLSDEEVYSIYERSQISYDFYSELGVCGGGQMIHGVVTIGGTTKEVAEEECKKLNNGKSIFEGWFREEGE